MIVLGITGGIGSGKSYVSRLLAQRGVPVFDCDSQAKRLTQEDSVIRRDLIALLGSHVYTEAGLNKPLLASYLFASEENASRINAIIHPRVRVVFREWVSSYLAKGSDVIAIESAILYESGFDAEVDKVLVVHAPLALRCERVVERDHTTVEQVQQRIASQLSDEVKCQRSDYIIENDGVMSLEDQIDKLFSYLEGIKASK